MKAGIIGCGNIGQAVARRIRPFGTRILVNDIVPVKPDFLIENHIEQDPLEQLLRESDFVTGHTDLNPTSRHLINEKTLSLMKPTAVLINTSRGPVIDEKALAEALATGKIAGAAMDVFETEPLPMDSPLRSMPNVLIAPHNCNFSPVACERVHWNTIRNLLIGLGIPHDDLDEIKKSY